MEKNFNLYTRDRKEILVTKKELKAHLMLQEFDLPKALLRLLTLGRDDPLFPQYLIRAAVRMQFITSLVYPVRGAGCNSWGEPYVTKPSIKTYEILFDGYCGNLDECADRLKEIFTGNNLDQQSLTPEYIKKVFEKYSAIKRYTLPMLGYHSDDFCHASFFEYVMLYVVEHDSYPDFPIHHGYRYPEMPGASNWDIEDYF